MLSVGERSVRSAREVIQKGDPELVSAVGSGEISVSAAAEIAEKPKDEQRKIVRSKSHAKHHKKKIAPRGSRAPAPAELDAASRHRADLHRLQFAWEVACETSLKEFVREHWIEIMRVRHEIGSILPHNEPANDGLDIPDFLRRAPA